MLEGVAILGDILTFYQEHYANEAFLRTARWRESVADLARLLGYRLAPGVGGRATFAFEIRGTAPVEIPTGFPLKADLEDLETPADFQTVSSLTAHPFLSRFHLYRPRLYRNRLAAGSMLVELHSVGNDPGQAAIDALKLKAGDQLMLIPPEPAWTVSGTSLSQQAAPQVVKIKNVNASLDRTLVEFETPLSTSWTLPVTAYRLGRSFRHFGHNAPPTFTVNTKDASGKINGAHEKNTHFTRHVFQNHACSNTSSSIDLPGELIPLDQQVNDLAEGSHLVVRTRISDSSTSGLYPLSVVKTVRSLRTATIGFATLNGPSTLLTLDSALIRHSGLFNFESDIRDYQVQELTSPPIRLRPRALFFTAPFSNGLKVLCFFGTLTQVKSLAGRRLILQHDDGRTLALSCVNTAADFTLPSGLADEPRMWPLSFNQAPNPFHRTDFDESAPSVTVFGNLADATQGKAESSTPLGNGDVRASFQTFALPKSPLTYLLSSSAIPPQVPELEIAVNGRIWSRVDSFFGRGPTEEIYIVREDADGGSYVQFGDGLTGARLPSGLKNVVARYRTGVGARGPLKPGAKPSAGARIEGLDKVQLPGLVTGGAPPEPADHAREIVAPERSRASAGSLVSATSRPKPSPSPASPRPPPPGRFPGRRADPHPPRPPRSRP